MKKSTWILLAAVFLLAAVAATVGALTVRLNDFQMDDEGAIPLNGENAQIVLGPEDITEPENTPAPAVTAEEPAPEEAPAPEAAETSPAEPTPEADPEASSVPGPTATPRPSPQPKKGFRAEDSDVRWMTNTQVEVFRVSYENGEQTVSVASENGDRVIAPGTENSYTFKLKNTGEVALDYSVDVDAYITPADVAIPVESRLSRYDGEWIVGGLEEYVDTATLDTAEDSGVLGAGKYTYYTMDWVWPFESGNDEYDTLLGNMAVEGDIVLTVVINTMAEESVDPDDNSGITPPQTGDDSILALWIALAVSSVVLMLILLLLYKRDEEKKRARTEGASR